MTLARLVVAIGFVLVAGCPRDPAVVDRPVAATPCSSAADCNPGGATCGLVRACVDQRCEDEPTRTVHCP